MPWKVVTNGVPVRRVLPGIAAPRSGSKDERVEQAIKFLDPQRITLNPDCGFGWSPRAMCNQKLRGLAAGAALVRKELTGRIDLVGTADGPLSPEEAQAILRGRDLHPALAPHPRLPDDTRLWAALQRASGGTWAGCIYDVDRIIEVLDAGLRQASAPAVQTPGASKGSS